jgi:aryl-alcohol dehydrogenase-like predicted oxidoreductase
MQNMNVPHKNLGSSGAKVSSLCLGTMNFGSFTEVDDSIKIIENFIEAGFNFIDTANVYNAGKSEEIVGKAIQGKRDRVFLATKVHFPTGTGLNEGGNSRVHILKEIDESLRRLQTEYIDLYWIHRPDENTPIEETLRTLNGLIIKGKIRYIGISSFPAWRIMEAIMIAERLGLEGFIAEQPLYNLLDRSIEEDVLMVAQKYGLGIMPWSPLANGWLTGKYRKGKSFPQATRITSKAIPDVNAQHIVQRFEVIEELSKMANQLSITMSQLSLVWLLQQPGVTSPIIGPRTLKQLKDSMPSVHVNIDKKILSAIDKLIPTGSRVGGKKHWE